MENMENKIHRKPSSILRIDSTKPRRASGGSVEFKIVPDGDEKKVLSPKATSPPLSVTWAFPDNSNDAKHHTTDLSNPDQTIPVNPETKEDSTNKPFKDEKKNLEKFHLNITSYNEYFPKHDKEKEPSINMEPTSPLEIPEQHESDDEDYSISVSAIMQRRASTRKTKKKGQKSPRRSSSPAGIGGSASGGLTSAAVDRRRSSVYTTSSGDTAISFEDTNQESTQEQIFENIRLHKEVLHGCKIQPWSMRRKLKLVQQAKSYVARHEGALQERFASSRSTKDLLARFRILLATKWQHTRRELANLSTVLIPWELRIKEIESHFGSVVASYFTFLRWLFWVNIVIVVVLVVFVVVPEILATDPHSKDDRKRMLPDEQQVASNLITIWEFEGFLKYSPLFYGYYSNKSVKWGYKLPMAYFMTGLVVYVYSFVATLRKMAENSRMSKLSSKDDECIFSWKIFTGWDFMIGHAETAHNRVASIVLGFKEALLEEAEKKKDTRNWKVIALRIFVNLIVTCLLGVSAYAVIVVVNRSTESKPEDSWWRRNEITYVMSSISFIFPMFFEALGLLEYYHPRQQLRLQLARIMLLNLLNLYSLIFALFDKISGMTDELTLIRDTYDTSASDLLQSDLLLSTLTDSTTNSILDFQSYLSSALTSTGEALQQMIAANLIAEPKKDTPTTEQSDSTINFQFCQQIPVNCSKPTDSVLNATLVSMFLINLTTTMYPDLVWTTFNWTLDGNLSTDFTSEYPNFTELLNFTSVFPSPSAFAVTNLPEFVEEDEEYDEESYALNYFEPGIIEVRNISKRETVGNFSNTFQDEEKLNMTNINIYDYMSELYGDLHQNMSFENFTDSALTDNTTNESTVSTFLFDTNYTFSTDDDAWNSTTSKNFDEYLIEKWNEFLEETTTTDITDDEDLCFITVCENVTDIPMETSTMSEVEASTIESTTQGEFTTELELTEQTTENSELTTKESRITTVYNCPVLEPQPTSMVSVNSTEMVPARKQMNYTTRRRLRDLCWETMFGQEIVKITVMDLLVTVGSTLLMDFFRALFVRFMNGCWCWDMEKKFPGYGDFKIAENILHLVNNQGMIWMGMFFSPGLAVLNLVKLVIMMYLRSWAVLTCNVPHEVVFRASRSNNFYLALLLTMLFLCVLPVGYAIVWLEPSWHCGPFSQNKRIFHLFTDTIHKTLPKPFHKPLDYIVSPAAIIPLLVLLILIIYYLISLTNALRESNQDLKNQLRKERTEERRKMWKITQAQPNDQAPNAISSRWKMALAPTPAADGVTPTGADDAKKTQARSELLARIMKKALRKSSATSDDESLTNPAVGDDGTDSESHEPLPHDKQQAEKKVKPKKNAALSSVSKMKGPWSQIIQMAKEKDPDAITPTASVQNKTNSHPKKIFQVKKSEINEKKSQIEKAQQENEESEEKERVVSERRRSLLRRQSQIPEKTLQPIKSDEIDTDNVIPQEEDEAFEEVKPTVEQQSEEPKPECSNGNGTADDGVKKHYRKKVHHTREKNVSLHPEKDKPDEQTTHKSMNNELDTNVPYIVKTSGPSTKVNIETDAIEVIPVKKEPHKGVKKLNNFFTLVREAVRAKKMEQPEEPKDKPPDTNLSENVSIAEIHKTLPSTSTKAQKDTSLQKRRDSSSSIRTENIPVIRISKTESDENILDVGKNPVKPNKKEPKDN